MRNGTKVMVSLLLASFLAACSASADEHVGQAQGYGGPVKVRIRQEGGKLTHVEILEHHETQGVGTKAIDAMPNAMVSANTWDVDAVSGATTTSNAIREAVRQAMGESGQPSQVPSPAFAAKSGMGMASNGRLGPGTDENGEPIHSFQVVFAHGLFDGQGRVQQLTIDQLEVLSPGAGGKAQFSGFPGQEGITEEGFQQEVALWVTKRQQGDEYKLPHGTWAEQMNAYEQLFTGMTVEDIEAWFAKYCSEESGRPLTAEAETQADQEKYAALSQEEKQQLADVTSSATISLRDEHGDVLTAIRRAWEAAQ